MKNERAEKDQERNKNNTGKHTQISIRLPNELLDQIQGLAEKERRTRSNMIAYLLREKLREIAKK
jgi:metal-responsive CopG/Arc/MetJ family transcriptional regulator